MDLMPYVENLRRQLAVAAEAGGPEARALAERLTGALESAARLALLEALSAAADEITRDLAPGSVDVRLRGGDPAFVVTPPPVPSPESPAGAPAPTAAGVPEAVPASGEEGGTARMTLRLPEHLKLRVEEAAGRQGISVNAWLVRAVSAAFEPGAGGRPADRAQQPQSGRSYTGWVR
ncbi:toxin-antitoxin system HicB family antitoxin [Actinomadura montaniterrae]|uniref:Toxin-antitoxin system HicB family antitoxin n=1 Tax=Actinomadura montaniterrae TaxID=1803903 RepID=A0A6L3VPT6_9ACTN|nr:toxin-antitoxin system HicB family antitoxin [Actinomadura montaniterrae]KAB2378160.1 toxin-antitoxin system HicB family antitoxin [Actinomadura montaniterrae]